MQLQMPGKGPIGRVGVRVDFGMPLDAQSECEGASDAYRFDRAVLGHPFHDNTIA